MEIKTITEEFIPCGLMQNVGYQYVKERVRAQK